MDYHRHVGMRVCSGYGETRTGVLGTDWTIADGLDAVGSVGSGDNSDRSSVEMEISGMEVEVSADSFWTSGVGNSAGIDA
jgi:hypothetical protein